MVSSCNDVLRIPRPLLVLMPLRFDGILSQHQPRRKGSGVYVVDLASHLELVLPDGRSKLFPPSTGCIELPLFSLTGA